MAINRLNIGLTGVQPGGLAKVIPSSVAVGSGSGSVSSNGTVSFSNASSVSLNGVFSSTYTHYLIRGEVSGASQGDIVFRLRASGTDSSANYALGRYYIGETVSIVAGNTNAQTGANSVTIGTYGTQKGSWTVQISNPFEAQHTSWSVLGSGAYFQIIGATHQATTSYDGFSYIGDMNITGTISVYGYTN